MPTRHHGDFITVTRPGWGGHSEVNALLIAPPAWTRDARCAETDPEIFFPDKGGSTQPAKKTCTRCPVQVECLDYALDSGERYGVWGGVSERERRKLSGRQRPTRDRDIPCGNPGCPEMFNHPGHAGRHRAVCAFGDDSLDNQQEPA